MTPIGKGESANPRLVASARPVLGLAAAMCLLGGAAAHGGAARHGEETQVNTVTTGGQAESAVATDAQGGFVVVWTSYAEAGVDADGGSIQARRFDRHGTPAGDDFLVNSATTLDQFRPRIAMRPGGEFVVAWSSYAHPADDLDDSAVAVRSFDASGTPAGVELEVNTVTSGVQRFPDVAVDPVTGNFVVVWEDLYDYSIRARHYSADGQPVGAPYAVNDEGSESKADARVGALGDDRFLVVWEMFNPEGDLAWGIQARRLAAGAIDGAQFQVNTYTTGNQDDPVVAAGNDGVAVVAWSSEGSAGTDTDGTSIQARFFGAAGPLGDQFQVNDETTGNQPGAQVGVDARGNFVVAWHSSASSGTDTSEMSVQARQFRAGGEPVDSQFQVNTTTTGQQARPAVAVEPRGDFVVTWDSYASGGTDVDGASVQVQRYDDVFRDDFEAGDWLRWSSVLAGSQ